MRPNNKDTYNFVDKVALITGASTGIGRSTALAFGRFGARVAVVDVNAEAARDTVEKVRANGGTAEFFPCDVSNAREVESTVDAVVGKFGRLDYAFNNAGVEGEPAPTHLCSEQNWNRVIDINLKGVWLCMKYEIPVMLKQKSGAIVNCSSIAGLVGFPGIPAYVASKHGVIGLTKTAALEHAKSNIRINAISPGVIQTPMIDRFVHGEASVRKQLVDGEPLGRVGEPEEVAAAALWLCSDQSSFVTGHSLVVDGGWVAQ